MGLGIGLSLAYNGWPFSKSVFGWYTWQWLISIVDLSGWFECFLRLISMVDLSGWFECLFSKVDFNGWFHWLISATGLSTLILNLTTRPSFLPSFLPSFINRQCPIVLRTMIISPCYCYVCLRVAVGGRIFRWLCVDDPRVFSYERVRSAQHPW